MAFVDFFVTVFALVKTATVRVQIGSLDDFMTVGTGDVFIAIVVILMFIVALGRREHPVALLAERPVLFITRR